MNPPLYNTIPSVAKPGWYLHAKNDHPEVRAKFFELLRQLPDLVVPIVIGRKRLAIFNRKHNNSPTEFYFDLLHHLLQDCLREPTQAVAIYLAQRGKNNSDRFQTAVEKALLPTGRTTGAAGSVVSRLVIVLSIVDYCLWALQRYTFKEDSRFLRRWRIATRPSSISTIRPGFQPTAPFTARTIRSLPSGLDPSKSRYRASKKRQKVLLSCQSWQPPHEASSRRGPTFCLW